MNTIRRFGGVRLVAVLAVGLAFGVGMLSPPEAQAQVEPTDLGTVTGLASTVTGSAVSNSTTAKVTIVQGKGLALSFKFNASAGTDVVTYYLYPSVDGVNRVTKPAWPLVSAATTTTDVIISTNWSPEQLAGYRAIFIGGISNAAATAIVTNKQVLFSRPY